MSFLNFCVSLCLFFLLLAAGPAAAGAAGCVPASGTYVGATTVSTTCTVPSTVIVAASDTVWDSNLALSMAIHNVDGTTDVWTVCGVVAITLGSDATGDIDVTPVPGLIMDDLSVCGATLGTVSFAAF